MTLLTEQKKYVNLNLPKKTNKQAKHNYTQIYCKKKNPRKYSKERYCIVRASI